MSNKKSRPTLDDFKREVLSDDKSQELYYELDAEYQVYHELVAARKAAGMTQTEVADRMGTRKPNIARLEGSPSSDRPSPTLKTLQRYAEAVNCHLEIRLVPNQDTHETR